MALVDASKVSQALNISVRRVQQLANEGMPREARGSYDVGKCILWYVRYLQRALEKKSILIGDGEHVSERASRVRLLVAEADLKEIQLAKEQGELISLKDMEKFWTKLVIDTRSQILSVGSRVAPELVGENSRAVIQAKIDNACKQILQQLAKRGGTSRIRIDQGQLVRADELHAV